MTADSLHALLDHVIDYAGLYPPASLPLPEVIANYRRYLLSPEAWMLNRLVLPLEKLDGVTLENHWRVTLLVNDEPGPLPHQIETLETKGATRLLLPTYCEVPLDQVEDGWVKLRTAGPSSANVAEFLCAAAALRLPFKATAGLHHPFRSTQHGFLNVLAGAAFAWSGMDVATLIRLLDETDPLAFQFRDQELRWRDWRASTTELARARRDFVHSFGSCSFEEPVQDLRALGLLE
jgi:hypothetical protein